MRSFLVLFLVLFSLNAYAIQKARIIVKEALVYADIGLKSPIGKIRFGKMIQVGDTKRKHGSIITTVLNGRIVYMKVSDLALEKDILGNPNDKLNTTEHDVEVILAKPTDKLNQNNYVQFTAGSMALGSAWKSLSEEFGEEAGNMLGFKAIFEHRPEIHNWSWGAGIDYYFTNQDALSFSMAALEINIYYSVIPFFGFFTADLMVGGIFSGALNIATNLGDEYKATLIGFHGGGQIRLFPYSKIGFTAGAKYGIMSFSGLKNISIDTDTEAELGSISGLEIYGGLTYRF